MIEAPRADQRQRRRKVEAERKDFARVNQFRRFQRHLRLHQISGADFILRAPLRRAPLRVARHFPRLRAQRSARKSKRQRTNHHSNRQHRSHVFLPQIDSEFATSFSQPGIQAQVLSGTDFSLWISISAWQRDQTANSNRSRQTEVCATGAESTIGDQSRSIEVELDWIHETAAIMRAKPERLRGPVAKQANHVRIGIFRQESRPLPQAREFLLRRWPETDWLRGRAACRRVRGSARRARRATRACRARRFFRASTTRI